MRSAFLTLVILSLSATAHATSFRDVSLEEITAQSTVVVEAEVLDTRYRQQAGRLPVISVASLRVIRYLRGHGPSNITLWQPGGVVNEMRYEVVGSPTLKKGERVVLFLRPKPGHAAGTFYLFAMELGAFRVQRGTDGTLWATRFSHQSGRSPSTLHAPEVNVSSSLPHSLPLWQLVARIRGVK